MRLTGLPIRASHGRRAGDKDIGRVTDEYMGADGSKHIEFEVFDEPDNQVYSEGLRQRWYTELSLGHHVDLKQGMVPKEVSICHKGARAGTLIYSGTDLNAYKQTQTHPVASPEKLNNDGTMEAMNTTPDKASEAVPVPAGAEQAQEQEQPVAPPATVSAEKPATGDKRSRDTEDVEKTPEERALEIIEGLPANQQEAIAQGWSATSQKLADTHAQLQDTQKNLEQAEKHNETLKVATKETARQLVASLREAYDQVGTQAPVNYMDVIEAETANNPTLAQ